MTPIQTRADTDLREALYNDRSVGTASRIQMPREAVTRLHGLVIDLDADILEPNPWFPPGETAEEFYAGIRPALERHAILRHAEVRDTGRWLHAIVWFREPVDLRSAADQRRWNGLHRVLKGSLPSDPAAPSLNALTRPVGGVNSKTGCRARTLEEGVPIDAGALLSWAEDVRKSPFSMIGLALFGDRRVSPCPFCNASASHMDLGDAAGFCYGPCRRVRLGRITEPFMKDLPRSGDAPGGRAHADTEPKKKERPSGRPEPDQARSIGAKKSTTADGKGEGPE